MNRVSQLFQLIVLTGPLLAASATIGAPAERLVVIGVDGLSPDGIQRAEALHLKGLCKQGAWTFHARAVMPTSSSPNWASMIMGAGPEQHGITSNDWEPTKFDIPPTDRGPDGRFPSVFTLLRDQQETAFSAVFHDWDGFGRLVAPKSADLIEDSDGPTNAMRHAIACLKERRPRLVFIQLDHVDHAGHEYGHGTPEYYAAVDSADRLVGEMLDGLEQAGLRTTTLVLVTSDHGGLGKKHGGATMAELEIPWIITGPGVKAGHEISAPVNTFDTAATIAAALGLKTPACWIARPVTEAFTDNALAHQ